MVMVMTTDSPQSTVTRDVRELHVSSQCVGREFVRQYYTLLNQAPEHLHRFYSHNSSFLHASCDSGEHVEDPVIGQQDIHKKIMSLNFRDCHAKIRQVDSHPTLGNGVVVQVTGELSNNGEPMRRFMQTFVLAPQSPKKYYVHNDIFRYQDEVFEDSDYEAQERAGESEGEIEAEPEPTKPPAPEQSPLEPAVFEPQQTVSNGDIHLEESPPEVVPPQPPVEEPAPPPEQEETPEPEPYEPQPETAPEVKEPEPPKEQQPEPKKFSWAALASKNTTASPQATTTGLPPTVIKSQQVAPKPAEPRDAGAPQPQRAPRPQREGQDFRRPRPGGPGRREMGEGEEGRPETRVQRPSRYPDSHQLFIGNLPHDINEDELKDHFAHYGNVMELRINTKSGGGRVPNFGFVVFDDPEPVQKILDSKPIMFRGEHRLNVEEKKARGEGRGRGDNRGPPRGDRGPPRGPGAPAGRGGGPSGGGRGPPPPKGGGAGGGPPRDRYPPRR
ncbi:ras GTPase-activating protein-binding protein 1-like [Branchiostoma lanceolatum]|uniref:ras GTPase-activating protein-binding protein 1-like n=1 Tax=Branchiostoma lanceolatum TaxID=7740 RepID=UPI001132B35E